MVSLLIVRDPAMCPTISGVLSAGGAVAARSTRRLIACCIICITDVHIRQKLDHLHRLFSFFFITTHLWYILNNQAREYCFLRKQNKVKKWRQHFFRKFTFVFIKCICRIAQGIMIKFNDLIQCLIRAEVSALSGGAMQARKCSIRLVFGEVDDQYTLWITMWHWSSVNK